MSPKSARAAGKRHAWQDLLQPGLRRAMIGRVLSSPSWCTFPGSTPSSTTPRPSSARRAGRWMPPCSRPSSSGSTNFVFTLVSFWVIDRHGRKPLYIAGSLGMTAALALLGPSARSDRFSGHARARPDPGLSGVLRVLHRARSSGPWSRRSSPIVSAAPPWPFPC